MNKEKKKEILKEALLAYKRASEDTWREANGCLFMKEVVYPNPSKEEEKAFNKLKECTDLTKTILRLCDDAMKELEESNSDFAFVEEVYYKKIKDLMNQVKGLIDDYNQTMKPVEKD